MNIQNAVVNDILCYMSTARHSFSEEEILTIVYSYYAHEGISSAKTLLVQVTNINSIKRRGDNKVKLEISDILRLFEEADKKKLQLPKFLADKYDAFPPINGFSLASRNIAALLDRIDELTKELEEFRITKNPMLDSFGQQADILSELGDIKKKVSIIEKRSDKQSQDNHATQQTFASVLSKGPPRQQNVAATVDPNFFDEWRTVQGRRSFNSTNAPQAANYSRTQQSGNRNAPNFAKQAHNGRILGTKANTTESGLRSANRKMDLFVARCDLQTTPNEIINYCKDSCKINVLNCIDLNSKSEYFKSFKLTVALSDRNALLSADMWPEGIIVRKFFKRRAANFDRSRHSDELNVSYRSANNAAITN